jgi:hypothetical protein
VSFVVVILALAVSLALPYTPQVRVAIVIAAVPFVLGLLSTSLVTCSRRGCGWSARSSPTSPGARRRWRRSGLVILADWGFYAVVASAAVGAAVVLVLDFVLVRPLATIRLGADPSVWRMLILAALPLGLALTLNEIYLRADTLIISLYRTDREVGLYGLAWRIYELVALFPALIMTSVFPLLSRYVETDEGRARRLCRPPTTCSGRSGCRWRPAGSCWRRGSSSSPAAPASRTRWSRCALLLPAGALAIRSTGSCSLRPWISRRTASRRRAVAPSFGRAGASTWP